jgi:hypothetical protein
MKGRDERGPWYLITGLIIGVLIGLAISWLFQPVDYTDTEPASLRSDYKDLYRVLIASAYMTNGDLVRARARLELLNDEDIYRSLAEQAQRTLAEEGTSDEARALGLLAIDIGQNVSNQGSIVVPEPPSTTGGAPSPSAEATTNTPTQAPSATNTQTPTHTYTSAPTQTELPQVSDTPELERNLTETQNPIPINTIAATPTPSLTPGAPFVLVESLRVCDQALSEPMIMVIAINASGEPAAGVEVIVLWNQGEERFYTGLKPEKGLGYADFSIVPGTRYSVRIADEGEPATGLSSVSCQNASGDVYWGAWKLEFVQP